MSQDCSRIGGTSGVLLSKITGIEEGLFGEYQAHSTQTVWGRAVYGGTEV